MVMHVVSVHVGGGLGACEDIKCLSACFSLSLSLSLSLSISPSLSRPLSRFSSLSLSRSPTFFRSRCFSLRSLFHTDTHLCACSVVFSYPYLPLYRDLYISFTTSLRTHHTHTHTHTQTYTLMHRNDIDPFRLALSKLVGAPRSPPCSQHFCRGQSVPWNTSADVRVHAYIASHLSSPDLLPLKQQYHHYCHHVSPIVTSGPITFSCHLTLSLSPSPPCPPSPRGAALSLSCARAISLSPSLSFSLTLSLSHSLTHSCPNSLSRAPIDLAHPAP
jgi:hypothetical protein